RVALRRFVERNEGAGGEDARRGVASGEHVFERFDRAGVSGNRVEHLDVSLDRALDGFELRSEDLRRLEAELGAAGGRLLELDARCERVEEVLPARGRLIETRERDECLGIPTEAREEVIVRPDRAFEVPELRLANLRDAEHEVALLETVLDEPFPL